MIRWIVIVFISFGLLALAYYWKKSPASDDQQKLIATIASNLQSEIRSFKDELDQVSNDPNSDLIWSGLKNYFFLRDSSSIIRWNSNRYLPDPSGFDNDSIEYHRSGNSHYLVIQQVLQDRRIITGFLVLQESYVIENQFLKTELNQSIFPKVVELSIQPNLNEGVIRYRGRALFSIALLGDTEYYSNIDWVAWITFSIGLILLLSGTWIGFQSLVKAGKRITAILMVFVVLLGLRLIMVYGSFPSLSSHTLLFNPVEFASSNFNNSIGNLLLNTIAILVVSILAFQVFRKDSSSIAKHQKMGLKVFYASVLFVLFFAAQLLPFLYLETIYHNSVITPDITQQLSMDWVRLSGWACILLSSLSGALLSLSFYRLASRILLKNWRHYLIAFGLAAIASLLYHFITERNYEIPFVLICINFIVLCYATLIKNSRLVLAGVSSLILFELIIYGLQYSAAIRWLTMERERESMVKFGNTFLVERDVLGEYMLDQAISKIEHDAFIQQQMVNPFNRLSAIDQKIRRSHLNAYFDRYDTRIYLYDNSGSSVGNVPVESLSDLIKEFAPIAENTGYKGIYVIRNPGNRLIKRYLAIVPVRYHVSGFIVIDMTLRQPLPSAVFPKLLLDSRFSSYSNNSSYSYAILNSNEVLSSTGEFNYQDQNFIKNYNQPELYEDEISINGYDHIGIQRGDNQIAVVSIKHYPLIYWLANFSLFLLLGISLVIIILVIYYLSNLNRRLGYSNRIRLYVYMALILPLMALAITSLRVNTISEIQRSEERSVRQARNVATSLSDVKLNGASDIEEILNRHSLSAGVDVTIYTSNGQLIASSQPDIYNNQIISRLMDPEALQMIKQGNYSFTKDDAIGTLQFKNTYSAILSDDFKSIEGIVSVPFFASQESFEKDQIRLVVNILVVFVVLFLIFYLLSDVALNWLIRPLQVVSSSLRQITLSGSNRKLKWDSNDEIGAIVKEYNTMLDNLVKSKDELERRQRESTWREMARQVAHEIKNPLTPIKLTLQRLQQASSTGNLDQENVGKNLNSVLHQVDILNDIASSFSAFAQMPEPKLARIDLVKLIKNVLQLFKENQGKAIDFNYEQEPVWVMADDKLFARIFSNIILNALQSERKNVPIEIKVLLKLNHPNITLLFVDNGDGIPNEILDKIFIPYFSTKETGSGLGLAIAKQGIEQAGGSISCQSIQGEGTTFSIQLPIVS